MRRILTASLKGHARRFVAGGIAIVLSVAYVAAVLIAIDSAKQTLQNAFGLHYAAADLVITPKEGQLAPEVVDKVRNAPGVEAVAVDSSAYLETRYPNGSKAFAQVASVPQDKELRWQEASSGRLPERDGEVAASARLVKSKGIKLGSTVELHAYGKSGRTFKVVGLIDAAWVANAGDFFMPESSIASFNQGGPPSGDLLVRTSGDASAAAIKAAAGPGATAMTGQQKVDEMVAAFTGGINMIGGMLLGFAAIAMFVSLLVVANTFTIMIAQRARELALFRCVGAGKGQVFRAVLAESLLLGTGFALVGAIAGIGVAQIGLQVVGRFAELNVPLDLALRPFALLIPFVIGVLTTVAAVLAPARRATRVPPLAALHPEAAVRVRSKAGAVRLVLGALLLLGGGALLAVGMQGTTSAAGMLVGIAGGVVSFLGVLLFAPILAPAAVRLLGLVARTGGVPGKVAIGNAVRNPRRTAATASALLVGVTLICMLVVGAASSQATVNKTLDDQFPFDVVVSLEGGGLPEKASDPPDALPASTAKALADVDGIDTVLTVPSVTGQLKGMESPVVVSGIDMKQAASVVRNPRPLDGLQPGVVVLSPSMAGAVSASNGSTLRVSVGSRSLDLKVRVINEMVTPEVMVTTSDLSKLSSSPVLTEVWAKTDTGVDAQKLVKGVKESLTTVPDAMVGGSFAERALYARILDVLLIVATGMLAMAVAIALVGVGNTLSLSVLERTRENALLRALGLTRGQLRGTLAIEALLISGSAVLIGLLLGSLYGYAGTAALLGAAQEVGSIQLSIPWPRMALIVLVALGAGLLASVLPARRAAKVPPAAALGDE
ncbi:ABC transporter permease [Flindersiella endophytica]